MKPLIIEGRYDSIVTKLSNQLFRVIKDSYAAVIHTEGEFAGKKIYYESGEDIPDPAAVSNFGIDDPQPAIYSEEVENKQMGLDFYLELKVQWIENFNDFRKGGDAFNEDTLYSDEVPLIQIRFQLDPAEYPNILSTVAMELRDTLRHEIEHLTQSGWNVKIGKFIKSDQAMRTKIEKGNMPAFKYFTLPKEVDANIQGLYYQAKKQRTPFSTVANEYLDLFVPDMITPEQKEIVLDVWRARLPALAIRQEL